MLVGYLGAPQLSLLDLRIAGNLLGVSFARLDTTSRVIKVVHVHPDQRAFLSPIVPVLIDSSDLLHRAFPILNRSKFKFVGLVTISLSELYEFSIEPYRNGDSTFTAEDLKALLLSALENTRVESAPPSRTRDLSELTLKGVNRDSVLQKVQSCLYRIRDKVRRSELQLQVYRFLAGERGLPDTGLPFLEAALKGELLDRFRKAVKKSKTIGIDAAAEEFLIDRFEIAFVLAKRDSLKERSRG